MIDKKTFKKTFAQPFEKASFRRTGQSWYLQGKDINGVVNLQKSNYSELYFVNVDFWLNSLGEFSLPFKEMPHLHYRAEGLFPDQRELILLACSLEDSNLQLLSQFVVFLAEQLVPFVVACQDENYVRTLLANGRLEDGPVTYKARVHLLGKSKTD